LPGREIHVTDVRFGSKADIQIGEQNVCYVPKADMADFGILQPLAFVSGAHQRVCQFLKV
jgi:hypothetical protein